MKPWIVIGFWAGLLALWTVVQLLFSPPLITLALLGGAALAVALLAVVVRRAPREPSEPDLSPATVLLVFGVAALVSGAELGTWCILLGALLAACGIASLVAEGRR